MSGRAEIETALAEIAELRACAMDERATGHEQRAAAGQADSDPEAQAAHARAAAADERAEGFERRAQTITADSDRDAERYTELSAAASERARAREQEALVSHARAEGQGTEGARRSLAEARARAHQAWAATHDERAHVHELRSEDDDEGATAAERVAREREQLALAEDERAQAAEQRVAGEELIDGQRGVAQDEATRQAAARERARREADSRIRRRIERSRSRDRGTLRRFRPGPGTTFYSPGMLGTSLPTRADQGAELDREVQAIARALDEHGPLQRRELAERVGARYWGPGRFREALRTAVEDGDARRVSRTTFAPADDDRG